MSQSWPAKRFVVFLLVLIGALCLVSPAWAGITATVNRTEVTLEEQIVLTVSVDGDVRSRPTLPTLVDFDVYSRGQTQQKVNIKGQIQQSIIFNYILVPHKTGTFTIGAVQANVAGRVHKSSPFTVKVLPPDTKPKDERELFITAHVSDKEPYVGEQVIYTFRFYRRVRTGNASLTWPDFEGVVVEDVGQQRDYDTTHGGQQFSVSEIKKAIFVQEEGSVTVSPAVLDVEVIVQRRSRFFGFPDLEAKTQQLKSAPIELNVRRLPRAPAGYSGLVGDFALKAQLSRRELHVGESTTLTLTVSGTGNANAIVEPKIVGLQKFKVYDDKPSGSINRKGNQLKGTRRFVKALVPMEAGELTIPAITLITFDPEEGIYRTHSRGPFNISALPAEGGEELNLTEGLHPGGGKVAVRVLGEDILPIYRRMDAVPRYRGARLQTAWWTAMALPPLLFGGLVLFQRRQDRYAADSGLRRRRLALKTALSAIKTAAKGEPEDLVPAVSRALRNYVGDRLGIEGGALTPREVGDLLRHHEVPEELVASVEEKLRWAEACEYGQAGNQSAVGGRPRPMQSTGSLCQNLGRPSPEAPESTVNSLDGAAVCAEAQRLLRQLERTL
ncbi:MAG: protein BatD [Proteobacteria bacterium]|nr:protein BatD [Pseudomonadota bacterium]